MESLAGFGETVGARQPHGAAPVAVVGVFVPEALDDGEVGLVAGERGEAGRDGVILAGLLHVREPTLGGDAPAKAEEDEALGRRGYRGGGGKALEAQGGEYGQGYKGATGAQEVPAGLGEAHGGKGYLVWNSGLAMRE